MAEYNFTIENKTSTGYDQLYPATKGEQVDVSEIATDLGLSGTVNVNDALKAAYEHGGGSSGATPELTPIVATSSDGLTYACTASHITSLAKGAMLTIMPNTVSKRVDPYLNVNGLGNKYIERALGTSLNSTKDFKNVSWMSANRPLRLMYNGTYWIAADYVSVDYTDLEGLKGTTALGTRKGTDSDTIQIPTSARARFLIYGSDSGGGGECLFFVTSLQSGVKLFYGASAPANVSFLDITWNTSNISIEFSTSGNYLTRDRCNSGLCDYWYIIFY
nr:MAG TPA: hypothetical protein [Caudoviricetes sp.]